MAEAKLPKDFDSLDRRIAQLLRAAIEDPAIHAFLAADESPDQDAAAPSRASLLSRVRSDLGTREAREARPYRLFRRGLAMALPVAGALAAIAVVAFLLVGMLTGGGAISAQEVLARAAAAAENPSAAGLTSAKAVVVSTEPYQYESLRCPKRDTLWFKGEKFRIELSGMGSPQCEKLFLIFVDDGEALWVYDPARNVVLKNPLPQHMIVYPMWIIGQPGAPGAGARAEIEQLVDMGRLTEQFVNAGRLTGEEYLVELEGEGEVLGRDAYVVKYIGPDGRVTRIWVDKEFYITLKQTFESPSPWSYEVIEFQANIDIPQETFRFEIPPGAEVIEEPDYIIIEEP